MMAAHSTRDPAVIHAAREAHVEQITAFQAAFGYPRYAQMSRARGQQMARDREQQRQAAAAAAAAAETPAAAAQAWRDGKRKARN